MFSNRSQFGQTLIELVIVIAVIVIVVGALTFATIASLRNAGLAKNQSQATKLAQEGLEKVRSLRERNGSVDYVRGDGSHTTKFNDLWPISFSCPSNCYFFLDSTDKLIGGNAAAFQIISTDFKRQLQIEEEGSDPNKQKKVTATVLWIDFAGEHKSQLTTVLRNTSL